MPQERSDRLSPGRLEAFSDGVIAVIITIMVLEIHVPGKEIANPAALRLALPLVLVYLLSFIQTGIYWVNHHYLVDDLDQVTHGILWSNLAVLFALSLIPAATEWVAVRGISSFSIALYAAVCAFPGVPWMVLSTLIQRRSDTPPASGMCETGCFHLPLPGSHPPGVCLSQNLHRHDRHRRRPLAPAASQNREPHARFNFGQARRNNALVKIGGECVPALNDDPG